MSLLFSVNVYANMDISAIVNMSFMFTIAEMLQYTMHRCRKLDNIGKGGGDPATWLGLFCDQK